MTARRWRPLCVLLVLAFCLAVAGCTKSETTPPSKRELSPAERADEGGAVVPTDSAVVTSPNDASTVATRPSVDAAMPTPREREEARGIAPLEPVDLEPGDPDRKPGRDLNEQVRESRGGSASVPASAQRSLVVLKSRRAVDPSSADVSKILLVYYDSGQKLVKQCYEQLRARDQSASGMMTLRFTVTTSGSVAEVAADSWSEELSKCVQAAATSWTFPAQKARAQFEFILKFVIG